MKMIPTKLHGYLDYGVGALLIAAPWLFGFAAGGAEVWVPVVLGVSAILYSLFTDYELGVTKGISMGTHLTLDMASGLMLAISPWLFGFADTVYAPHLLFGILEIGVALATRRKPQYGPDHTRHHGSTLHTR